MEKHKFKKGDRAIVFNALEWSKTLDLPEGNSKYYQSAMVLKVRKDEHNRLLADVKFDSGQISKGHFQDGMKKIESHQHLTMEEEKMYCICCGKITTWTKAATTIKCDDCVNVVAIITNT